MHAKCICGTKYQTQGSTIYRISIILKGEKWSQLSRIYDQDNKLLKFIFTSYNQEETFQFLNVFFIQRRARQFITFVRKEINFPFHNKSMLLSDYINSSEGVKVKIVEECLKDEELMISLKMFPILRLVRMHTVTYCNRHGDKIKLPI